MLLNKTICATIKALLRDSRDSKCVILVLALREISYAQQVIATGNTNIKIAVS